MFGGLILASWVVGQCAGGYCPSPAILLSPREYIVGPIIDVPSTSGVQRRSWQRVVMPGGKIREVWGWPEAGAVRWIESEQPETPPTATIGPEPVTAEAKPKALNFGLDLAKMRSDHRVIRASDPETLQRVEGELRAATQEQDAAKKKSPDPDEEEKKKPVGPVQRVEDEISLAVAGIVAAFLIVGGLVLVIRSRKP